MIDLLCLWMQSWCAVLQLQKSLPSFRRLSTELVNYSNEWKEYLQVSVTSEYVH